MSGTLEIQNSLNYAKATEEAAYLRQFDKTTSERFNRRKGFQRTPEEAYVGVEFENEYRAEPKFPIFKEFTFHSEGSLRNSGFELVLRSPCKLEQLEGVCKPVFSFFKKNPPLNPPRASTHVHFDVSQMSYRQLITWASVYFLFESIFSEIAGPSRQQNMYCLRAQDSKAIVTGLSKEILENRPYTSALFTDNMRYASVNFAAVSKFNSLEFRMLPAVSSYPILDLWTSLLNKTREYALSAKSSLDIISKFNETPSEDFPSLVFGEHLTSKTEDLIKRSLSSFADSIRDGFIMFAPILHNLGKDTSARLKQLDAAISEYLAKMPAEKSNAVKGKTSNRFDVLFASPEFPGLNIRVAQNLIPVLDYEATLPENDALEATEPARSRAAFHSMLTRDL